MLAFNGTADPILFFNGGVGTSKGGLSNRRPQPVGNGGPVLGIPHHHGAGQGRTSTAPAFPPTVQTWAAKDRCDPHSTDTRIASQVILRRYVVPTGDGGPVLHHPRRRARLAG